MTKRSYYIFGLITLLGLLSGFIRWQFATGFLLGAIVSFITYKITEMFCDNALDTQNPSGSMGHFMINYGIWAVALVVCAVNPNYVNVIACAIGITAIKISIIVESLIFRD